MIPGDILCLPVNPTAPKVKWQWADAKVLGLHPQFVELEYIAGERDGMRIALPPDELDRLLGREGGEEWKEDRA